ncbi:transmembrane protein 20 [Thecamonas trahens ATCC 50062]|uniref:Transmembrane protein 20 n=1 Tax=Thecamonas trahens ATCC 50062 TaxID=461836 RepID=A0A0L0D922_THETB|nr:transmembrane protein 20 [Thecamonas trahens ATCC 50062]KNC48730.1 transmembrane protein 20 [Thecamonas trahens ATCC 50062]|eukprot:XP_013762782.1 transmembrane protein 20 [Thecamonas trahens ATCC 50062]
MATLPSSRSNSMTRVRPSRLTEMEGESGGTGGDDDWMTALLPDRWRHVVGITLVALSAFVFSVMSLLVKVVGSSLSSFNLVFIRAMVQLVLAIFYLWYHAISPYKAEWPLKRKIVLVMRGVFGISGVSAIYFAMQYLPLGDSQALFFSSAVFAGVAARIVLGERFTALDLAISLVAMVGVVCVAQPVAIFGSSSGAASDASVTSGQRWLAIGLALFGAWCSAGSYVCIRIVGKSANYQILTFYMAVVGVIVPPLIALGQGELRAPHGASEWLGSIGIGICGFTGQSLINLGVQSTAAGTASVIRLLDVVFAFIWQIIILHDRPLPWSIVGAIIIMCSITAKTWIKLRQSPPGPLPDVPATYIRLVENLSSTSDFSDDIELALLRASLSPSAANDMQLPSSEE